MQVASRANVIFFRFEHGLAPDAAPAGVHRLAARAPTAAVAPIPAWLAAVVFVLREHGTRSMSTKEATNDDNSIGDVWKFNRTNRCDEPPGSQQ